MGHQNNKPFLTLFSGRTFELVPGLEIKSLQPPTTGLQNWFNEEDVLTTEL